MQAVFKQVSAIKNKVLNTLVLLIIGTVFGWGSAFWVLQQNLDSVCGLVNARNQFINFVTGDSKR